MSRVNALHTVRVAAVPRYEVRVIRVLTVNSKTFYFHDKADSGTAVELAES